MVWFSLLFWNLVKDASRNGCAAGLRIASGGRARCSTNLFCFKCYSYRVYQTKLLESKRDVLRTFIFKTQTIVLHNSHFHSHWCHCRVMFLSKTFIALISSVHFALGAPSDAAIGTTVKLDCQWLNFLLSTIVRSFSSLFITRWDFRWCFQHSNWHCIFPRGSLCRPTSRELEVAPSSDPTLKAAWNCKCYPGTSFRFF